MPDKEKKPPLAPLPANQEQHCLAEHSPSPPASDDKSAQPLDQQGDKSPYQRGINPLQVTSPRKRRKPDDHDPRYDLIESQSQVEPASSRMLITDYSTRGAKAKAVGTLLGLLGPIGLTFALPYAYEGSIYQNQQGGLTQTIHIGFISGLVSNYLYPTAFIDAPPIFYQAYSYLPAFSAANGSITKIICIALTSLIVLVAIAINIIAAGLITQTLYQDAIKHHTCPRLCLPTYSAFFVIRSMLHFTWSAALMEPLSGRKNIKKIGLLALMLVSYFANASFFYEAIKTIDPKGWEKRNPLAFAFVLFMNAPMAALGAKSIFQIPQMASDCYSFLRQINQQSRFKQCTKIPLLIMLLACSVYSGSIPATLNHDTVQSDTIDKLSWVIASICNSRFALRCLIKNQPSWLAKPIKHLRIDLYRGLFKEKTDLRAPGTPEPSQALLSIVDQGAGEHYTL